jgi:DNA repair protein RadC
MRESRDFAFIMQVYEASIQYSLVRIGHDEAFNSPSQIVEYMNGAFDDAPLQESFYVVCLNRKNRPLCRTRITIGTATSALAHPREIFRAAPSSADLTVTRQIRDAGQLMGIDLLDHVIIGTKEDDPTGRGYYSFSGAGII